VSFTVFIPARYASTRLPGKPLLEIAGKPLIQHAYERACESPATRVVIATDDERIRSAAQTFGAETIMTASDHTSGTERIAEASAKLGIADEAVIVNLQGDEAHMPQAVIRQVGELLGGDDSADMATLYRPITDVEEFKDPNVVKLVFDAQGYALYFSRSPIPWHGPADPDAGTPPVMEAYRHIGLYAYRARFLRQYAALPPCAEERLERLEQLRALHHGIKIRVAQALREVPPGIDSPADLERARTSFA